MIFIFIKFSCLQEKRLRRTAYGVSAEQYRFSLAMCIFEKLWLFKKLHGNIIKVFNCIETKFPIQ